MTKAGEAIPSGATWALRELVGDRLRSDTGLRQSHANTWTWIAAEPPDAVIFPNSIEELCEIVKIAEVHRVPVIAFGSGTSLEGHVNAPQGGLSIDFKNMSRIRHVDHDNMLCVVEPGVTLAALNSELSGTDLFFSVDPGAQTATLGGMAATRASGSNTVRYGSMRENVLALKAVVTGGRVISTATRAPKSAAGYDLTHLIVGSEGTLGLIGELTLRLWPRPKARSVMIATFDTLHDACRTVIQARRQGLRPARIELLDALAVEVVNQHSSLTLDRAPTLLIELHEAPETLEAGIERATRCISKHTSRPPELVSGDEACQTIWQARHDAFVALSARWPGKSVLATDVCVPISALAEAVAEARQVLIDLNLTAPIVGHVGDGNFHLLPVWDPDDREQQDRIRQLLQRLADLALRLQGTCTGEHGIGQGKIAFLEAEAGDAIAVMRQIKRALDPSGIFNPGKIFHA